MTTATFNPWATTTHKDHEPEPEPEPEGARPGGDYYPINPDAPDEGRDYREPEPEPEPATSSEALEHQADELELPVNALTGKAYQGRNIARLMGAAIEHGYTGPEWAGFTQWRKLGRTVRRGEHGTACLTVVTAAGEDGKGTRKPRGFRVFHRDQTDALVTVAEVA